MTQSHRYPKTSCPVCDSKDLDGSVESIDEVCLNCGYVIHDEEKGNDPDLEPRMGSADPSEKDDWLSQCRVRNATEQRLAKAFDEIERVSDQLEIGKQCRESAADIYCDAFREGVTDGRKTACVVTACLRIATTKSDTPIPTGRFIQDSDITGGQFRSCLTTLRDDLDISSELVKSASYLEVLGSDLNLDSEEITRTEYWLEDISESSRLVGKDPAGTAAAAVYFTHDEITQSEAAEAAGISTETIRQRAHLFRELASHD